MTPLLIAFALPHFTVVLSILAAAGWALSHAPTVFGSINQLKIGNPEYNEWHTCPSAVTSGMPVLFGNTSLVAEDAYDSSTGGATFNSDGWYSLTVIAQSTQSPVAAEQINPGDELFASGTYDATTGITYNLTIDKTRGNCPFGVYEGTSPILAGTTNTAAPVKLKIGTSPGPYAS